MGNRSRIIGAFATTVALLGCHDQTQGGASSAPPRAAVPLVDQTPVQAAIALGTTPLAVDEVGVPRLLRGSSGPALPATSPSTSAMLHVARIAPAWGVHGGAVPQLVAVGDVAVRGGTVSRLRQLIDGVPIDGSELRVMTSADGKLVAASGILRSANAPKTGARWSFDEAGAVSRAIAAKYAGASGVKVSRSRARKVWFAASRAADAALVPAWVVEAYAASSAKTTSSDAFRIVLSADGRVLAERNLQADATFSYRVFAETTGEMHPADGPVVDSTPNAAGHPTGAYPAYAQPALVAVNGLNHPQGQMGPDAWLATGKTETIGNNAEAYADFNAPDGLTFGDFRATTTAGGTFDRTYDFTQEPMATQGQQMVGITSLFYIVNWMHDFWYDGGFTEAAGNAQNANYGRGGEDRDALLAEAQDNALGGSRNNANMSTPDDGMPPRMQVFLWSGKETRTLTIGARTPVSGTASFGPKNFDITGDIVLANDGVGTATDGCTVLPDCTGKIILVDRGSCSFKTKALNVQNAGGIAMLLANNAASTSPPGMGDDATITTAITIPVLSILQAEGTQLKTDLAAGTVSTTFHREVGPEAEGSLDTSVLAHEFGHYVHHRLSQCNTSLCGAMSEGWGDFSSLLVIARDGDNLMGAYPMAIYSTQGFSADPAYYGIRRAPYSADHAINDLSFRHMADGVALPTTHPIQVSGANSEVHNAGEVWASMMWEGYVALQQANTSFDDARLKMRQYVVAGLLLAPPDATPTETRDAILTAARAANQADHDALAAAYARRGFGSCAVSPPRDSTNFMGIVESNEVKGNGVLGAPVMALATACDSDSVLDGGETAHITVPVANTGHTALNNVVATLSSATAGVTVTSAPVAIGSLGPAATTMAGFDVAVDSSLADATAADLKVTLTSTDGCNDMVEQPVAMLVNSDDAPASSATDSFDASTSVWATATGDTTWSHVRLTALDGAWSGVDPGTRVDASLVSPPLVADATAPLTITFSHSFAFEYSGNSYWDGGVIEYTTDGGTTWTDIASLLAASPYNGTLAANADNPLAGRAAFGNKNASYPAADMVSLELGTQLAGQTFQLRFRIASDSSTGAAGWQIDDLAVTGIVGTPFPTLVPDAGSCDANPMTPDAGVDSGSDTNPEMGDGGGCCQSNRPASGSGILAVGVLAVLMRRRRRK